jgi:hypothetical protein
MRDTVLFICEGTQHLSSAIALAKNLKKTGIDASLFYAHAYPTDPGCRIFKHILNDNMIVPGFLQNVGLVIFFTNESSPFCMTSIRIGFIAKRTETPTITIQHGWIQPGLNYQANLQKVGFLGRGTDSSPALWHFSPVLQYFGSGGIGYPLGTNDVSIKVPQKDNINVLISTNLNWNVYSRENIVGFLRTLMQLKQEFPFLKFMHRAHPAENANTIASEIGMYMETLGISVGIWQDIGTAIDWADIVISTPSTVVLDAYFKETPVFVYGFQSFEEALADVEGITFRSGKQLTSLVADLLTEGKYSDPKFSGLQPEIFEEVVKKKIESTKEFSLSEEDYLQYRLFCTS